MYELKYISVVPCVIPNLVDTIFVDGTKNIFSNLNFSLAMFLKCFLIFGQIEPHVSYTHVSYIKKTCSLKDKINSGELRSRLGIHSIRDVIQAMRLRWFGHLERMEEDNWVSKCRDLVVPGTKPRGRPRKTWQEVIRTDLRQKNLRPELTQSRSD